LNTKTQRHKDLTKTGGKPLFCKASVPFARWCQKHSICILQAKTHPSPPCLGREKEAFLYRKEKTLKIGFCLNGNTNPNFYSSRTPSLNREGRGGSPVGGGAFWGGSP